MLTIESPCPRESCGARALYQPPGLGEGVWMCSACMCEVSVAKPEPKPVNVTCSVDSGPVWDRDVWRHAVDRIRDNMAKQADEQAIAAIHDHRVGYASWDDAFPPSHLTFPRARCIAVNIGFSVDGET